MKVVILAGGLGTRLREETEFRPKPMITVGGKPILWHIMKAYAHYGFRDFIVCLGYKGEMIKDYFLNYEAMNSNFTVSLGLPKQVRYHTSHLEKDWRVTLVDTGQKAQTGTRIKRVEKYIKGDLFMLTYGDGVGDINIKELLKFHKSHDKIGTITGVHASSRFGELKMENGQVTRFHEKPQVSDALINGGFFVFKREIFDYLWEEDDCALEAKPLEKLTKDGQLMAYTHRGFWQCIDTYRELEFLNNLWRNKNPPWKVWK